MVTREQAFERLRGNLELTRLQEVMVAERQNNIRAAMERRLIVTDSFLTGSYRRHTLIRPLSQADVDIIVVLDRSYSQRGPRAVLELVKNTLAAEYSRTTKISRNGQAVTMSFADFIVDVVPAFARPWWSTWDDESWNICDSGSDRWIATNPKRHVEISSKANALHRGGLVPRIKQLKAWNRTAGAPLRSFHLEALAWSIFGKSVLWYHPQSSDWDSARYFFKKARGKLRESLSDPAGTGKDVGAYLSGSALDEAVRKVERAYKCCEDAEEAAVNSNLVVMHEAYSRVFGNFYLS
jgi:hypothetical protein